MLDFVMISTRSTKRGHIEIYPKFKVMTSSDLMIRGGDFYAIWNESTQKWSTEEQVAINLIDAELKVYYEEHKNEFEDRVHVLYLWDSESGMIDKWHKYCQKQLWDSYHMLDEKLIFSNMETTKEDYASKSLDYPLEKGSIDAYDELMGTLYSEEERTKIEWAIGSIVCGESKRIQKFLVLYGSAGTGKSTVLNIIQSLFEGYYSVFDAKALGSASNTFALEAFKSNPLVAIQHDGDLSRIEDNTRLNSLVSHEMMTVNEKFKSTYTNRFKSFLFIGTNKPVKITDSMSGLIRRLIDVSPSGNKVPVEKYNQLTSQIIFELGAIAYHCREVYLNDPGKYDSYVPLTMMGATNDFYNFMLESYYIFEKEDSVTLKAAWEMYKEYCVDAKVLYPYSKRVFKEELRNYFYDFKERAQLEDDSRVRNLYLGFKTDKFKSDIKDVSNTESNWIELKEQESIFDEVCSDCIAQYGNDDEVPISKWDNVTTKLSDIDTSRLHYVRVPENHIVIDFDIKDEEGNKSFELNLKEANKFPKTYAELSKGGNGMHLHYIYEGDVSKLKNIYNENIEVKVFKGKSSLRRRLSKCNDIPIQTIKSGLPLKGEKKMVNVDTIKSEKGLRSMIERNMHKEFHPGTKPSIDFIDKILEDAYSSGLIYDVRDMKHRLISFAASSTHQGDYCLKKVAHMKLAAKAILEKDEEPEIEELDNRNRPIVFYDVEVFPNLFLICWKYQGKDKSVVRMINPNPKEIEQLLAYNLIGFNCRRYDNHLLYACLLGYDNEQLYNLSQRIINGEKGAFFGKAYNISYTDIYDFSSKKQSLKKFEIELGIHHQELGLPWDEPVPEKLWDKVAEYCDNDVLATEAVFDARQADFQAREILADIAGMSVNSTTNALTTKIIFEGDRNPQTKFNYRHMGEFEEGDGSYILDCLPNNPDEKLDPEYTRFTKDGKPIFPGYTYINGVSSYRGENPGEGGYVYEEPGIYEDIVVDDITSMHPHSIKAESLFGDYFTDRFYSLVQIRVAIKHKEFDKAKKMLGGVLSKYLTDEKAAADLAQALKIAINSVYGLTSAKFDNPFRDIRNKDNIVAKRGALFMINLKHEVQNRGYTVAHIKTDSIKIPNADERILKFVYDYGQLYGYTFEHEATYEKLCLVNKAVYVAKHASKKHCEDLYGYIPKDNAKHEGKWTATGTQFQVPYVFKRIFSKEPIIFEDLCESKEVKSSLYLDFNEDLEDVTDIEKEIKKINRELGKAENPNDIQKLTDEKNRLKEAASVGHNYHFVGKVGQFCPVKPGAGGGLLLREAVNKKTGEISYAAATGSDGYRWLESEIVETNKLEDSIDKSYYEDLADKAVEAVSEYGDYEWFIS